ncbi:TMV resistance protein N-like [Pyrus ussuriensis x Pyrus communis]|uniref:TMV resistance protein N-like n=1 Tax=Pyrus ussuriensis x Pyrus communis TaxID=2448454 RepID=A0A5N5EYB8_9ROSA|nr:TMV resistance protein N-like [Pyrus ussuriensis x Pyrus communis]
MLPKVAQTQTFYEIGERIATMGRFLNSLYHHRASSTNHFTFCCLYFFRVCRTQENLEWGASVLRRYPCLEVMSKIACKSITLNFECTPTFSTEAHNRLFEQLSIKSFPSSGELENWKKMVHQKNQLFLIDEEVANVFILQEAAVEVERQGTGEGGDVSELFGESEGPQGTKKPTFVSREEPLGAKMYQKDKPVLDTTLKELEVSNREVKQILEKTSSPAEEFQPPATTAFGKPIVPEIPVVLEVTSPEGSGIIPPPQVSENDPLQPLKETTHPPPPSKASGSIQADLPRPPLTSGVMGIPIPRPKKKTKVADVTSISTSESFPSLPIEAALSATAEGIGGTHPPLVSTPSAASLPKLVKKFGQIKTKLQSSLSSSESPLLQNAHQIFKDWMKRDFTASFSLKILHDAEKALTELYKVQLLSKAQYESFLNFFENL